MKKVVILRSSLKGGKIQGEGSVRHWEKDIYYQRGVEGTIHKNSEGVEVKELPLSTGWEAPMCRKPL